MNEEWKPVHGYEHAYAISNWGRVISKGRMSKQYTGRTGVAHYVAEKLRRPSKKNGYYFCWMYDKDGKRRMKYIHRLVGMHFVDGFFPGAVIDHIDRDRCNNCSTNLRWVAQFVNVANSDHAALRKACCRKGRWYARIAVRGKVYALGGYSTEYEANRAYERARTIANDAMCI